MKHHFTSLKLPNVSTPSTLSPPDSSAFDKLDFALLFIYSSHKHSLKIKRLAPESILINPEHSSCVLINTSYTHLAILFVLSCSEFFLISYLAVDVMNCKHTYGGWPRPRPSTFFVSSSSASNLAVPSKMIRWSAQVAAFQNNFWFVLFGRTDSWWFWCFLE